MAWPGHVHEPTAFACSEEHFPQGMTVEGDAVMRRKSFVAKASFGVWLSLAACSGQQGYLYTPSTTTLTSAEPAQSRTADYPFPPDSPQGDIRLATSGLAKGSADAPTAVQLRMTVRNRSQESWFIDPREQKLVLVARGDQRTINATASTTSSVPVEILPQQSAAIELSFDLPPTAAKPSEIPAFDAVWTVRVGGRPITTRTTFERLVAPAITGTWAETLPLTERAPR